MNNRIRETTEQWDDVPAKVIGRRKPCRVNLESGAGFLRMGLDRKVRIPGREKGVYRYKTHEEAQPW